MSSPSLFCFFPLRFRFAYCIIITPFFFLLLPVRVLCRKGSASLPSNVSTVSLTCICGVRLLRFCCFSLFCYICLAPLTFTHFFSLFSARPLHTVLRLFTTVCVCVYVSLISPLKKVENSAERIKYIHIQIFFYRPARTPQSSCNLFIIIILFFNKYILSIDRQ